MKVKKQKKRPEQLALQTQRSKLQHAFPLKISFNLCEDSIACFVGEKKSPKKRNRRSNSLPKNKHSPIRSQRNDKSPPRHTPQPRSECEDIVQGSLNSILSEIERKGIDCEWTEQQQPTPPSDQLDRQTQNLMTVFSVNSSFSKSHASTIDVHPSLLFFQPPAFPSYYYDYYPKAYDEGSLYQVVAQNIASDLRTTVMIRNIPNKYTIKQLSEEIDLHFENTYDFLYLPCDIKNQCNVGYGFINFLTTHHLAEFYRGFQGKRWARFRSEKICNLTYARLQGLDSLIEHFQNSKVQKDKKYRPIIRYAQISHLIKNQQLL